MSFEPDNERLVLHNERGGNKVEIDCFTGWSKDTVLHSKDGKHIAFVRGNGGAGAHVTVDGNDGPEFRSISNLAMSPDGRHVAYVAQDTPNSYYVVVDGTKGPHSRAFCRRRSTAKAINLTLSLTAL